MGKMGNVGGGKSGISHFSQKREKSCSFPGPAAARCRSAGRPPPPAAVDMRTVLWAVADTVHALAAGAAVGAKEQPAEGD